MMNIVNGLTFVVAANATACVGILLRKKFGVKALFVAYVLIAAYTWIALITRGGMSGFDGTDKYNIFGLPFMAAINFTYFKRRWQELT